jgi:hypothetical protein
MYRLAVERVPRAFPPNVPRHFEVVPRFRDAPTVAPETGPLDRLRECQSVLVIADIENWVYGARDLDREIDFAALARLLKAKLRRASLHAFFSAPHGDSVVTDRLTDLGWTAHQRAIINRPARVGANRCANADLAIAFGTAKLLGHQRADGVLLGTGDGFLALDCARAVRANFKRCSLIGTMSLAGSTSRLIDARATREIDVNVEIGADAMRPLGS